MVVDSVTVPADVVFFLDVGVNTTSDSDHPQELVDVVATVVTHSSVNDQDVVDVQFIADFKGFILRR